MVLRAPHPPRRWKVFYLAEGLTEPTIVKIETSEEHNMPKKHGKTHDLVVPAGETLVLGPNVAGAEKYLRTVVFQTPRDLVKLGLVGSLDNLKLLIQGVQQATEALLSRQRQGLAPYYPASEVVRPDLGRFGSFRAYSDDVPFGEAFLFWQFARSLTSKQVGRLSQDTPWRADVEAIQVLWIPVPSLVIEEGSTLVVDVPFLHVSPGGLLIESGGRLVLGPSISSLHIQTIDIQGHSAYFDGEMPGWVTNIDGRGRSGYTLAPERTPVPDGVPGSRGVNGIDAHCKESWDICGNDCPPTVGGTGKPGSPAEDGWAGCDAESGKTVVINVQNYLGGITIDCGGGWGEDGGQGGRGGDGGQGGDGGWGDSCQPNAYGGTGGRGGNGGCGGPGGRGGNGGNAFVYYQNNPSGEQPHLDVRGGSSGNDGSDGWGGNGGAPGRTGRGLLGPGVFSNIGIGPRPTSGANGDSGMHISLPVEHGIPGQSGFVQTP